MKLSSNIKVKKGLANIFPFSKYTAQAIYPNVYLPQKVYDNLKTNKPKAEYVAILLHEQKHIQRQKKEGWLKWDLKYLLSPQFCFNEELAAIKVSMKYLKKHQKKYDLKRKAKILSGWLYLKPVTYQDAKQELEKAWEKA